MHVMDTGRWEKDNGGIDEKSRREEEGKYCRRNKVRGGERARYSEIPAHRGD